jgi:diguanylate cyclase (GGDEF)-like protein
LFSAALPTPNLLKSIEFIKINKLRGIWPKSPVWRPHQPHLTLGGRVSITPTELASQLILDAIIKSDNGLAVLDKNNIFLFYNTAFAGMFNLVDDYLVGKHFDELLTWEYHNRQGLTLKWDTLEKWLSYVNSSQRSSQYRHFEVDLRDGRWLLLSEQAHSSGALIVICTDISQQKITEAALRNAQAELQVLALTDELTGLANRRHFMQQLDLEIKRTNRNKKPLCLAMLDIDFFKKINDNHGHPMGDKILKHFSDFLIAHIRACDFAGRVGGEEFAILLPETEIVDAQRIIERIIKNMANEKIGEIRYTFSAGLMNFPHHINPDKNWILSRADKALYIAKSTGRNKVVVGEN